MISQKNSISKLPISALTLGTWVFGGDSWSGSNRENNLNAVHAALDHGINIIDTAPIYSNGLSEEIVGQAMRGKRDQVIIATKCGLRAQGKKITIDLSKKSIFNELHASLKRMNIDCIDLYQCHWPDPNTPIEETIDALNQLKNQGKIRHVGLSNFKPEQIKEALPYTQITSIQDQYSLLTRNVEEAILPLCRNENINFLAYGPLAGGILTGKYSQAHSFVKNDARSFFYKFYKGDAYEKVSTLLSQLQKFNRPLNQLCLNWIRQQNGVTSVIVGCRNVDQVIKNTEALSWDLTQDELSQINDIIKGFRLNDGATA